MIRFTLLLVLVVSVFAHEVHFEDEIVPKKWPAIEISPEDLPELPWEAIQAEVLTNGELKAGFIQADVTKFAQKIIEKIQAFLVKKGFDPSQLGDQQIKLIPTGTLTLSNGLLQDLSSINISSSVIAKYSSSTKVLEVTLPISFDKLLITYDYKVKIILLSVSGGINAKISNVKLNLHLGFNFSSLHAFVDKADIRDSGSVDLSFTGHGLVDWVINLLSNVVTTLLHGIIINIINSIVQSPVESVVGAINKGIDTLLQRNSTEFFTF